MLYGFFPIILDINGRTSRGHTGGRSHRISHPPSFCGACLNFPREKDSAIPFPRRPSSRILCTNDLNRSPPVGHFYNNSLLYFNFPYFFNDCCCCCCFSHSAHWLPARKNYSGVLYTVANLARGLLNRKKKKKKKVWQRPAPPPPPPRALLVRRK